ncbi:MAG: dipeptide ABC transporter ATP-binding protein [Firmicutes bacterium]|nr:dipeptide ABC transporter ATP-binding protein [Bacillota bacterium]
MSYLLEVNDLTKHFVAKRGFGPWKSIRVTQAVDGVSFGIGEGETLGLVGESGCGKSTAGMLILRLLEASAGQVRFDGQDVFSLDEEAMSLLRRDMQIIFQDPFASLDPRLTVFGILREPFEIQNMFTNKEREEVILELLDMVGLRPEYVSRYPHEFSGGQRQRIAIARALALHPRLIIADEPVSALDVSIQAQILNLLQDLQDRFGLSYLFISHDLSVVKHISDRVAVMYLGKLVELAPQRELYARPLHPYTHSLLSAIPIPDPRQRKKPKKLLRGDVPSPSDPPPGCRFHTRCPYRRSICGETEPSWREIETHRYIACHYPLD